MAYNSDNLRCICNAYLVTFIIRYILTIRQMSDKFQFVILLNGLHPRKVESVFAISTKGFDLEPKATINRKGKLYWTLYVG